MLLHCPRVQALFPREKVLLKHEGPAWMLWAEHGGSLILRVGDLKFSEMAGSGEDSGLFLELDLSPAEALIHKIEGFAAHHHLALSPPSAPAPEFCARPILAACHIPDKKLFIFAEESLLRAWPGVADAMEVEVRGAFQARAVPCREADLMIHLAPSDLAQLLSYLRGLARAAG